MAGNKTTGRKGKDISHKTIIIGNPRTDLTRKLAKDRNTEVLSPHTTISQVLKKYGSDHNLSIYSHGFVYNVKIGSWMSEDWADEMAKYLKEQGWR